MAAQALDGPQDEPPFSVALFAAWLARGWWCDPCEAWYVPAGSPRRAGPGGPVAAWYRLQQPDLENRGRAFLTPLVHPAFRRRGLGRELVAHAARRAAHDGRAFLDSVTVRGSAGEAFAGRLGAEPGLADARRHLDLRKVPVGGSPGCARRPPRTRPVPSRLLPERFDDDRPVRGRQPAVGSPLFAAGHEPPSGLHSRHMPDPRPRPRKEPRPGIGPPATYRLR